MLLLAQLQNKNMTNISRTTSNVNPYAKNMNYSIIIELKNTTNKPILKYLSMLHTEFKQHSKNP